MSPHYHAATILRKENISKKKEGGKDVKKVNKHAIHSAKINKCIKGTLQPRSSHGAHETNLYIDVY